MISRSIVKTARVLIAALTVGALTACSGDSRIASARIEREPAPVLDTTLQLALSDQVLEALDRGVALTLRFRVAGQLLRGKVITSRRVGLRWLPLTQQYQLVDLDLGSVRNFSRRAKLLAALDRVRLSLPAEWSTLQPDSDCSLQIALEIDALPAPLRLPALLSSAWNLDPPVHRWTVEP